MNTIVQRIVALLLIALTIFGMSPAALATDIGPEDTPTDPTQPTEETVPEETVTEETAPETTSPTEPTVPEESTEPVEETPTEETLPTEPEPTEAPVEEPAEEPVEEETKPIPDMEEEVTASRISIGASEIPMLFASRAAVQGTHYHRAIIWLTTDDAKLDFTYKGKNYSVDRLYIHGVVADGTRSVAYCVDPGVLTTESSGAYSGSETAWNDLDIDTQTAVGLAVLYGAPNGMSSPTKKTMLTYEFATQIIIHEILLGYRSNLPPYACTNDKIITKFGTNADGTSNNRKREITSGSADYSSLHGEYIDRKTLRSAYDTIAANMAAHYVLPSFASRYNAAAKTYEMTQQSDGSYAVTLTDTNNILSKCTFTNGNGLTYSVSGNKLTITSKTPFDTAKSCSFNGSSGVSKNVPNLETQTFFLWKAGSNQRLVSLQEATSDPVPLYFNVLAKESKGTAQIIKKSTNGGTVAGWTFTVKNASGTTIGTYTTPASGVITLELEPGTYSVTEKASSDKYWVNDATATKTVTVKAGETASVTFTNKWRGQAQIIKTTTNGGTVKGWHFTVKTSGGTKVGDYVTNDTGIITLDLEPGTYQVTETDSQGKYWVNDATPTKTVTVKAGQTAKVTFTNQYRGQAQIVKTTTNGGTVKGWHFAVKTSGGTKIGDYVTDSTGVITLDLEPGTYQVTETDSQGKYWVNDPTPTKTVTVKAGETAKVTFHNQYRGQAQIVKTTTNGGTLKGWEFTVKNASGTKVGTYTTDDSGIITLDLEPGTYTVVESNRNDPYWYCDTAPKTVTVKAGETAKVSFENKWIGKAKIIKTLSNPEAGSVEGWNFIITDSTGKEVGKYKTDSTGTILTDLEPGTYTVTEVLEENSLWQCTTKNPQTITVAAGKTAEVTFTNALRPGKISIEKVDFQGKHMSGVEFRLEWSQDGKTWKPVTYTTEKVPQIGGCTTNGLKDGKLLTSSTGLVEFTGLYPTLQYRLIETKTNEGFQLLKDSIKVDDLTVNEDLHIILRVINFHEFTLPDTGANDFRWMALGITLCGIACVTALTFLRRKKV